MNLKKKILLVIIGLEIVMIGGITAFVFYLSSDTVRINRQMEQAQRFMLEEDYEQAIASYQFVIDIDPKNVEAYLGMAETYIAADEQEKAVKILERGVKRTDSEELQEALDKYTIEPAQETETKTEMESESSDEAQTKEETALSVQSEEQISEQSHGDMFREYLAGTLIPAYGVFDPYQSGTMHSMEEKWLDPAGVMDAMIFDFDQDGQDEMLVCYTQQDGGETSYVVNMAMYEITDGKVELASSVPFVAYHDMQQGGVWSQPVALSEEEWCEMSLNASVVNVNGICYILCEQYRLYSAFADGQTQDYWALTYQNGTFQYALSFTQVGGGSAEFKYAGYDFTDGNCTNRQMYYNESYEDEESAMYDTFESAIIAFFDKYGIHIKTDIDHYRKDNKGTILSLGENDIIRLFDFANDMQNYDYNEGIYDFRAALTSYGEPLNN